MNIVHLSKIRSLEKIKFTIRFNINNSNIRTNSQPKVKIKSDYVIYDLFIMINYFFAKSLF